MDGNPKLISVQYLRGIAAMCVVIFHISFQLSKAGYPILDTLQSGVDLFFVISGFIMFYSTDGGRSLTPFEFLKRRAIRIVPLYWAITLAMIVVLLIAPQFVKSSVLDPIHALASLTFVPMRNPANNYYYPLVTLGWTLNYEMFFYLIFAIAMAFGRGLFLLALVAAVITGLSLIGIIIKPLGVLGVYTAPLMMEFVFGMVVAALLARVTERRKASPLILVMLLFVLFALPAGFNEDRYWRYGIPAAMITFTAVTIDWPELYLPRLMGDASYSIYLSHFFVLSALTQLWNKFGSYSLTGAVLFYISAIVIVGATGISCYWLVERPLTKTTKYVFASMAKLRLSFANT